MFHFGFPISSHDDFLNALLSSLLLFFCMLEKYVRDDKLYFLENVSNLECVRMG
jgi:hypothetical protein